MIPTAWGGRSSKESGRPLAVILGCTGLTLSAWERDFYRDADPFGFILFARNCESPSQVRRLTAALRDAVGRADAPILIDQEGGRVARLKPPVWSEWPAPALFGQLYLTDPALALEGAELNARSIARTLIDLGIDVDCAPLADLLLPGAHDIIGDRSFGADPSAVAALCTATARGFLSSGVLPVVKHLPGHGRASVDSHLALPTVETDRAELTRTDFEAFRQTCDCPWGMTAHVVYTAIDPSRPATTSPEVIESVVRGTIGFDGLLLSDDLSMKALSGTLAARVAESQAAGCDVALHCNGDTSEMQAVVSGSDALTDSAMVRIEKANEVRRRRTTVAVLDPGAEADRIQAIRQRVRDLSA